MHKHLFNGRVVPAAALAIATIALVNSFGGWSYAAQGVEFLLGQANTEPGTTKLSGSIKTGNVLVIKNTNKKGGPPLALLTPPGKAPFAVNSAVKVAALNADYLDGLDSTAFLRSTAAIDAATLGGLAPSAFVRTTTSPWHYIGDPGEPAFVASWTNYDASSPPTFPHAAYRIDSNHIVHLQGMIAGGSIGITAFQLPPAACPAFSSYFAVPSNSAFGEVYVTKNDCQVVPAFGSSVWVSLNGIDYPDTTSDAGIAIAAQH